MGIRKIEEIYKEEIDGYRPEDYTLERVSVEARDGKQIPVTFFYNNKRMSSESPLILHSELDLKSRNYLSNYKYMPKIYNEQKISIVRIWNCWKEESFMHFHMLEVPKI